MHESTDHRLVIDDPDHARIAARQLAAGAAVAHGFANFYAITSRGDESTVGRVNTMKGRPVGQTGSVTLPPNQIPSLFDWTQLPDGLTRDRMEQVFDTFFTLGPFGFRGPAAAHVGSALRTTDGDISTTQVIAPGYDCPSNDFLALAAEASGADLLYITSANRSRHLTGAEDSPAHWRAEGVRADFAETPALVLLEHTNERIARRRYPSHRPMSTTIIGFHRAQRRDGRIRLTLERHGSLDVRTVARLLDGLDLGLTIGPRALARLPQRRYPLASEARRAS